MNTRSSQKAISSAFPLNALRLTAEIIILMGIGAIGVLLHARFRQHFGVPGHWGFVYMLLLISGKLITKRSYAASLSSIGAAFMLLMPLNYQDGPLMPLIYLLPGFITDLGFRLGHAWKTNLLLIALIGGAAYMTLPLSRIILTAVTNLPYGSFMKWGFAGATAFHFLFGLAGALAGASLVKVYRHLRRQ